MQNTDQPDATQPASSTPAPEPAAPAKPKILQKIPPQGGKGWRNFPGNQNQNMKFKPTRSNAVRFIQARRAPGK